MNKVTRAYAICFSDGSPVIGTIRRNRSDVVDIKRYERPYCEHFAYQVYPIKIVIQIEDGLETGD